MLRLAEVRSRAARLPGPDEIRALEAAALAKPGNYSGEVLTTAASSARDVMPSFGKTRYRWLRTVRCDR